MYVTLRLLNIPGLTFMELHRVQKSPKAQILQIVIHLLSFTDLGVL